MIPTPDESMQEAGEKYMAAAFAAGANVGERKWAADGFAKGYAAGVRRSAELRRQAIARERAIQRIASGEVEGFLP